MMIIMIKGLKFGDKFFALIRDGRGKIYDLNWKLLNNLLRVRRIKDV